MGAYVESKQFQYIYLGYCKHHGNSNCLKDFLAQHTGTITLDELREHFYVEVLNGNISIKCHAYETDWRDECRQSVYTNRVLGVEPCPNCEGRGENDDHNHSPCNACKMTGYKDGIV